MADGPVYHYTSVRTLFKIVRSKRFRLGNVFFMNDYMEVEWLWRQVREEIQDRKSAAPEHDSRYLDLLHERIGEGGFDYVFCGCFSSLGDDLSQWRAYADDGRGVVIGVDTTQVVEANKRNGIDPPEEHRVNYEKAEQAQKVKESIDGFVQSVSQVGADTDSIDLVVACSYHKLAWHAAVCKNPAFDKEEEVRLVLRPSEGLKGHEKSLYDKSFFERFPYGVEFCHRGGRIVPYAEIDLSLQAIRSIRLGPKFGGEMEKGALQLFLSKEGVDKEVVEGLSRSQASYR